MSDRSGSVLIEATLGNDCRKSLFLDDIKLVFTEACLGKGVVHAWFVDHAMEQFGLLSPCRAFHNVLSNAMGFG